MILTIDKEKVMKRFGRSISSYNGEALVQKRMARKLMQKIMDLGITNHQRILEIGCGTGFLTHELLENFRPGYYMINDLVGTMQFEIEKITLAHEFAHWSFAPGDAEMLTFPGDFDMVVSTSTIQWFQHPASFFSSIVRSMASGSIIAFSTFGKDNFMEIKVLQGVCLKYPSMEELHSWLSSSFEMLHCSEEIIQLHFETPWDVLKHIRHTGVNSISDKHWNRRDLSNFEAKYNELYANPDSSVSLTYHPIIVIARKNK